MIKEKNKLINMPRICLIIDNPLRDLDGLCLIAWHLSIAGAEVFLVPMHLQGFDIPALKPDIILANYARTNNIDLLKSYKKQGSRVAVLDTEGIGTWWPQHSHLLQQQGVNSFIDEYYCWGSEQAEILEELTTFPRNRIQVTGCPRYDFIAEPWRRALPENDIPPGYILINTNFPVVNPQFSQNSNSEIKGWVKVGWGSQSRAEAFANASRQVFDGVKEAVRLIAKELPEQTFILRPHPFESIEPYISLEEELPNLKLRKQGTSLQWINHATALLHLNCFTGIEAGLMKIEALGFEWLNHKELKEQTSEPTHVSRNASNTNEIIEWLKELVTGSFLPPLDKREKTLETLISKNYYAIDGQSSKRVAQSLINLSNKPIYEDTEALSIGNRTRLANSLRKHIGYTGASLIKNLYLPHKIRLEREQKIPSLNDIREVIQRIQSTAGSAQNIFISSARYSDYIAPNRASFRSVRITSS